MHLIKENMDRQLEWCAEAPFYTLGRSPPILPRLRPHHERDWGSHDRLVRLRHALLRDPKEHLGLPNKQDVKEGVIAYKIAAHAADLAKATRPLVSGRPVEQGAVRVPLGGPVQSQPGPGDRPGVSRRNPAAGQREVAHFCSMCGPHFCAMKITRTCANMRRSRAWPSRRRSPKAWKKGARVP